MLTTTTHSNHETYTMGRFGHECTMPPPHRMTASWGTSRTRSYIAWRKLLPSLTISVVVNDEMQMTCFTKACGDVGESLQSPPKWYTPANQPGHMHTKDRMDHTYKHHWGDVCSPHQAPHWMGQGHK